MLIDRLSLKFSGDFLRKELADRSLSIPTRPNYNITRGTTTTTLSRAEGLWRVHQMAWGYGSDRATEQRIVNARSEGVLAQPSFRFAIRENRCIIPVDSFYVETIKEMKRKVYRVVPFTDAPMYVAGIWEQLDQTKCGFTIMTVKSNKDVLRLTDRMPLIFFDRQTASNWCEPMNVSQLVDWLIGVPGGRLKYYQVSERVLQGINAPMLHEPIEENLTLFD